MEQAVVNSMIELSKAGLVGVMIALILLCGATIFMIYKISCNHISHTNAIFEKNTETLTKLIDAQQVTTDAVNRLVDRL